MCAHIMAFCLIGMRLYSTCYDYVALAGAAHLTLSGMLMHAFYRTNQLPISTIISRKHWQVMSLMGIQL